MKLGIVGLPNVGKSTLFNSLTKAGAESANYPFCTIDPNVGVVTVPDERLKLLGDFYHSKKVTPAVIEFVDIAGLVKGASKGEGLGNQFLANIREVDAIVHVVRCFEDPNVIHVDGSIDPLRDIETINLELIFSDIEILERRIAKVTKTARMDKEAAKEKVKANIMKILAKEYDIEEEDFLSAEIEVVPAGEARDYGFDRSIIMGYGHDDRVCAYPSFMAMLAMEKPEITSVCLLVDKEEIGSVGASGMQSRFFENTVAEVMNAAEDYSELKLRRALKNSKVLSSDVSAAFDPNYPSVMTKRNAAYFGRGLVFNKYTGARGKSGSNDANAEYVAKVRGIFDDSNVAFQTAELGKVDVGGGGTIAYIAALYGMNVIDSGVAVLSMHAPWEVTSKADIYEAKKAYKAFLENA